MVRVRSRPLPRPARPAHPLRILVLVMFLAGLVPVSGLARQAEQDPGPTALLVTWQTADGETFRAVVTDAASIERIVAALAGDGYAGIPNGVLAHGDGGVNAPHAWHLLDVTVVDMTIELCDGTASMVDADIDYWVDVVGRFCPWSAIVVAAEPLGTGPAPTVSPTAEPTATVIPTLAPTESPPTTATVAPTVVIPVETPSAPGTDPERPADSATGSTIPPINEGHAPALALPDTGSGTTAPQSLDWRLTAMRSGVLTIILISLLAGCQLANRRAGTLDPR